MGKILEKEIGATDVDVTVVTTTETVIVTSPLVKIPVATCRVVIRAWYRIQSGTATTGLTQSIRRGALVTDPLVGEASACAISAAAGSTEEHGVCVTEQLQNQESVQYSLTCTQAGATGNGTARQATIEVEILNG